MESDFVPAHAANCNGEVVEHGAIMLDNCSTLPGYATDAFWMVVESADTPLEVLVHFLRISVDYEDERGRNAIFSTIICRIQPG